MSSRSFKAFSRNGRLFDESAAQHVSDWPESTVVCTCIGVTKGQLVRAYQAGHTSPAALAAFTGASTVCATCKVAVSSLAGVSVQEPPPPGRRALLVGALASLVFAILFVLSPPIPYATKSIGVSIRWDQLWLNGTLRQATGYAAAAFSVMTLLLSARKRIRRFTQGHVGTWRWLHAAAGTSALLGLAVHTGMCLGTQLNSILAVAFLGAVTTGSLSGFLFAGSDQMAFAARFRSAAILTHVVALWVLPVLLAFHILSVYFF